MKLRTIGAVLAGAAMIGATVAGAAAAATAPAKSWFIDPATGQPNVTVVVGAQANASDVVSASLIAAAVGNMATVEETASTTKTASATFDKMYQFDYSAATGVWAAKTPLWTRAPCGAVSNLYDNFYLFNDDYLSVDLLDNGNWDANNWRNVALVMPAEVRGAGNVLGARALNTLWFSNSPKEWNSKDRVYKFSVTGSPGTTVDYWLKNDPVATDNAYAGGSYDDGDGQFTFKWTGGLFSPAAWVDIQKSTCDYNFGGTATAMEAHEEIQVILFDKLVDNSFNGIVDFAGDKGHASGIVYRTAEIRYPLLENGQNICGVVHCDGMIDFETARKGYLNEIKFLGKMYKPMFAGATMYKNEDNQWASLGGYFMYGKPFAEKEKIMKVGDVYNFHGWTVTLNDVNIYENKAYITVAGPALTAPFTFIMVMDAIGVEACGPCCPDCATYGGGGAFTSNPTRRTEYDPYLVKTTVSKTKSGYDYTFFKYVNFMLDGIKTFVGADGTYLAEFNLYAIEDFGYLEDKGCCDPFVTTPNDYGLAIYGGWANATFWAYDTPYDLHLWEPAAACAACPDANFDTLELQLCDTIIVPDCETTYTVNGPENYFTIDITDVKFDKATYDSLGTPLPAYSSVTVPSAADSDGAKIVIKQTTAGDTIKYTANVKIDPVELIKLDIEVNTATNTKNLVLVGGPVYNSIVKDLVDMGASTVDWATSAGEWEWIADPMAKGYDVLIVAGANREETRMAAEDLVAMLN